MITDERIAELRAECDPPPKQAETIFVDEADFDEDPDRWISLAGPTQSVVALGARGVVASMGGTYRPPLEITHAELRAVLDRLALAEAERDAMAETLSTLVHWHDRGHIDDSWWDSAREAVGAEEP